MSKIVLNVYRPEKGVCGVVRLNEQAEKLVKQLQRETGLSAKHIVSLISFSCDVPAIRTAKVVLTGAKNCAAHLTVPGSNRGMSLSGRWVSGMI